MTAGAPFWAVGDLHGCLESFEALLARLPSDAKLLFMGDIVNRGPESLETLRRVKSLCEEGRAECLLGNHDLHLLCVAAGHAKPHGRDTISGILEAADRDELIEWLRHQKIAIFREGTLFVHAGVHPSWNLETALALAAEVEANLSGDGWKPYLHGMYGNTQWEPGLAGEERMRAVLNAFTRTRFVNSADGTLDFSVKEGLKEAGPGLIPWFEQKERAIRGTPVAIGHWSMLGLCVRPDFIAIDTGCLWGGALTAMRFPDRKAVMERSPLWRAPR